MNIIKSLFKTTYYHGTSMAAIGATQLEHRVMQARGELGRVWPTPDKKLAIEYAKRSAARTKTDPVVLTLQSNQPLKYDDSIGGRHSHPCWNPHKAPIKILDIQKLGNDKETP